MNELQSIMMAFIIIAIGYTVGRIGIKNITLGDSAVLLVALIFGHFGVVIPDIFQTCGLLFFVTSVGLTAAPEFWVNIKKGALSFMLIGFYSPNTYIRNDGRCANKYSGFGCCHRSNK